MKLRPELNSPQTIDAIDFKKIEHAQIGSIREIVEKARRDYFDLFSIGMIGYRWCNVISK